MAVSPCEEAKAYLQETVDENDSLHFSSSCFQIVKQGVDAVDHYCLDVLPVVLENSSFPMTLTSPYHSSHGQDVYNVSVVTDKGFTNPQCSSQVALLSFLQVPQQTESPMCLVAHWNCKNFSTSEYSDCSMDIDIENESVETPKIDDRTVGSSMKTGGASTRDFSWKINLQMGGQIMHLLMSHIIMLLKYSSRDKSTTERTPDTPNNKVGRYRRSPSFNSRKVAFLFSLLPEFEQIVNFGFTGIIEVPIGKDEIYEEYLLRVYCHTYSISKNTKVLLFTLDSAHLYYLRSSIGTIVLIYLTLRVKADIFDTQSQG